MAIGDLRKDIACKYSYLTDPKNKNDLACNIRGKIAKKELIYNFFLFQFKWLFDHLIVVFPINNYFQIY